jgi:membrane protein implicated in regulation of membrane protease activity
MYISPEVMSEVVAEWKVDLPLAGALVLVLVLASLLLARRWVRTQKERKLGRERERQRRDFWGWG